MSDDNHEPEAPDSELLPMEQKSSAPSRNDLLHLAASYHRSGPLPDSREFAAYEKILPGAADRILRMAEKQSDHRMEMEKAVIVGSIVNERWGLAGAVITVLATIVLTGYLAKIGLGAWGIAAVLGEIAGIVLSVHHIANKNAEERKHKSEMQKELDEEG